MRILSVTAQKVDSTGSGVFLTELVRQFDKSGHSQAVICGVAPGDVIRLPESVQVYPVHYRSEHLPFPVCGMSDEMPYESTRYRDLTEEMTQQLFAAFRTRILEAVETFRPDVILCHHLYFLAALVRQLCPRIPVFGQCHGSDLRQFRKNPWQHAFISAGIPQLDGIFTLHEQQKEQICQIHGIPSERVYVMGTGYNSSVFRCIPEVQNTRVRGKCRLIFAGKVSEKKGVISLLRSLNQVSHPERVSLAIAGGAGNEAEYAQILALAQQAKCKVEFLGKLTHQELAVQMNASDAFVLPSFYEGLPLVVIEAMACGLRVICTDLPGIRPWLDRAIPGNGVLFVQPPQMRNEDEPIAEALPIFENDLARAIEQISHQPLADRNLVRCVSWEALCSRMCAIWKNA